MISLVCALLEGAASKLDGIPAVLAGEPIFRDPKGAALWGKLARAAKISAGTEITLLGRGTRGAAFSLGDRVLKITEDESEARASSLIRQYPDPARHTADIHAVYRLVGQEIEQYAILQELLEPLTEQDQRWSRFADFWPAWTRTHEYHAMDPEAVQKFFHATEQGGLVTRDDPQWVAFKEWFTGLAQYLTEHGIRYHDFWHRNLLKRGSAYVAIDFGYSRSEEPENGYDIEVLARYRAINAATS